MNTVVIYVSGGVVQEVRGSNPETRIILVDHDNIEAGDAPPPLPENVDEWKVLL